jgi:hypothetical protein
MMDSVTDTSISNHFTMTNLFNQSKNVGDRNLLVSQMWKGENVKVVFAWFAFVHQREVKSTKNSKNMTTEN